MFKKNLKKIKQRKKHSPKKMQDFKLYKVTVSKHPFEQRKVLAFQHFQRTQNLMFALAVWPSIWQSSSNGQKMIEQKKEEMFNEKMVRKEKS